MKKKIKNLKNLTQKKPRFFSRTCSEPHLFSLRVAHLSAQTQSSARVQITIAFAVKVDHTTWMTQMIILAGHPHTIRITEEQITEFFKKTSQKWMAIMTNNLPVVPITIAFSYVHVVGVVMAYTAADKTISVSQIMGPHVDNYVEDITEANEISALLANQETAHNLG